MTRMDNEWSKFYTDIDGNLRIRTEVRNFLQRVAEGDVPGYSAIEIFGENPDVAEGPEDNWDGGGLYTFSETADIDRISSSDDDDTQTIMISGLDADWHELTQFATLTGHTPAAITPMVRIHEKRNMSATDTAGDVYCFVNGATTDGVPDVSTNIRSVILTGNNKTLMAMCTVPAGKTGYLLNGWGAVSKSGGVIAVNAQLSARSCLFGGSFAVQMRFSCMTTGNSSQERTFRRPLPIPQRTDILIRTEAVSGDCITSGGFTLICKDNS